MERFPGKQIKLSTGTVIELNEEACQRAVVKYAQAINAAVDLAGYIDQTMGVKVEPTKSN